MILEVDLHYLIAQSKHYRVLSPHPLLHVHVRVHLQLLPLGLCGGRGIVSAGEVLHSGAVGAVSACQT